MPDSDDSPYTIPGEPPVGRSSRQRRSYWEGVFAEARKYPGQWRRLVRTFSHSTAAQMASDVRSSYRRDVTKMRFRGLLQGEQWDAVWEADPTDEADDRGFMWVRFTASAPGAGATAVAVGSGGGTRVIDEW